MPKAYNYDLRRKVIEAIELNGRKRTEASQMFRISRNTIISGSNSEQPQGISKQDPAIIMAIATKLPIGKNFEHLSESIQIKRKGNSPNCEMTRLATEQSVGHYIHSSSPAKKNLWLPRTR